MVCSVEKLTRKSMEVKMSSETGNWPLYFDQDLDTRARLERSEKGKQEQEEKEKKERKRREKAALR